jgi:hypothetical protein
LHSAVRENAARIAAAFFVGEIRQCCARDAIVRLPLPQDEKNVARSPFGHIAIAPRASLELCSEGNCRVTRKNFRAALPTITDNRLALGE